MTHPAQNQGRVCPYGACARRAWTPTGRDSPVALASLALQRFAPGRFAAWLACPTALLRIRYWRVWLAGDVQFGRGFGTGLGDLGGVNGAAVVVEEVRELLIGAAQYLRAVPGSGHDVVNDALL